METERGTFYGSDGVVYVQIRKRRRHVPVPIYTNMAVASSSATTALMLTEMFLMRVGMFTSGCKTCLVVSSSVSQIVLSLS
jgi:hypothetical protein